LGGLGIKDLACFKRALRLRWMWYRWAAPDKPWTGLTIKMSKSEEELFKTCTIITLGNGKGQDFGKTIGYMGKLQWTSLLRASGWQGAKTIPSPVPCRDDGGCEDFAE